MILFLDEQLTGLKPFLTSLGWEVETVNDVGLKQAKDLQILEHAVQNNRILITEDTQLAQLAELHKLRHVWISSAKIAKLVNEELQSSEGIS